MRNTKELKSLSGNTWVSMQSKLGESGKRIWEKGEVKITGLVGLEAFRKQPQVRASIELCSGIEKIVRAQ